MKRLMTVFLVGVVLFTSIPATAATCPTETDILVEFEGPDNRTIASVLYGDGVPPLAHYYVADDTDTGQAFVVAVYKEANGVPGLQRNDPTVGEDTCANPDELIL